MGFNVKGKVAFVTGANRGIGEAIVEQLIAQGATKVYLAVRQVSSVEAQVNKFGGKVNAIPFDLTDPDSIQRAAKIAGDVDLVVSNAGYLEPVALFDDGFEKAFKNELEVNTFGLWRLAKAFDPILRAKKEAAFVQLNSVGSMRNFDGISSYCASKAASYIFTQALRTSWADANIQVVSVHPGPIATDMIRQVGMYEIASAPSVVAEGITTALEQGQFHLFPDSVARDFEGAYQGFAEAIIEADLNAEE